MISDYNYVFFYGHGMAKESQGPFDHTFIAFNTKDQPIEGQPTNLVWLSASWIEEYVDDKTRWIALASCKTLYLTDEGVDNFANNVFGGGSFEPEKVHLHGIVGMKTDWLDHWWWFGTIATGKDTFERYGELLKEHKSFKDAWFQAVYEKQRKEIAGWVFWQGKAAVLYIVLEVCTPYYCFEVDYSLEGLEPYTYYLPYSPYQYHDPPYQSVVYMTLVYEYQS